jgi:HTH-type transcriptional regulator/antitoxin HigA
MEYKIIKNEAQYDTYCARVMKLAAMKPTKEIEEEIETIELFIEKWDKEHYKTHELAPIPLLKLLMENQGYRQAELARLLEVDKSYVSLILSYKKGLSKDIIRKLATIFKVHQEAFNKPYELISIVNRGHKNEKLMNVKKEMKSIS